MDVAHKVLISIVVIGITVIIILHTRNAKQQKQKQKQEQMQMQEQEQEQEQEQMQMQDGGRGSGRKVLVLDLDETLVHFEERSNSVTFRPHTSWFLKKAAGIFDEIVVFTAATEPYAKSIVDELERRSGVHINRRYSRESCGMLDGTVVKDLRVLGEPDTTQLLFVDNTPSVFRLQPQSGIQIADFWGDQNDTELINVFVELEMKTRVM